ncbi:hypothetical protein [Jeotgalibacillus marinus]|uniref:Uncharacterized protein n=1 Tax=Jeotgalibacillus marinus TaxID=86667 RepID=A0ABV3Q503_9BACL
MAYRKVFGGVSYLNVLKYLLIIIALVLEIIAVILLTINLDKAAILFLLFGITLVMLIIVLMAKRIVEKRRDEENDYSDY